MLRKLLLYLLICTAGSKLSAQYFTVAGTVADSSLSPIPEVNIFITNGSVVAKSDNLGHFFFELRTGEYEVVFSHPNYQQVRIKVVLDKKNDTINVILPTLVQQIGTINITAKYKDPGPEMMRKAIAKRDYWASKFPSHSCDVYIRAFEEYNKPKKVSNVWHSDTAENKPKKKHDEPTGNMAEIVMKRDYMPPNKIKETRDGVSIRGDKTGLFFLSTTEGDFNFYQNLVHIKALSDMPVLSPLAGTALLSYKFHFLGSYKDAQGRRILKIKMEPRLVSNSVFTGEIHLVDTLFSIYRIEIQYPKNQLNEYNQFNAAIEFNQAPDSSQTISSQRFDYYAKAGKGKFTGYTLVTYTNYELNKTFPRHYFGMEISSAKDSAYDRDSAFWASKRATPLNNTELRFINRSDSIKRVLNSTAYLDSMQKVTNKVTLKKLFLEGQEYENREKGINLDFMPLMFIVQPWYPGGTRLSLWNTIEKKFKNKKEISFVENLNYGILNKDIRGTVAFSTLYNPFRRSYINISAGKNFAFINNNAAFLDLARRNNFYQNTHLSVYHQHEVVNGLMLRITGEFSERKDISGMTFDKFGDSLFENNLPATFGTHRAFFTYINLSYTPFQKYIRDPRQKVILGSRWPTFSINYSKAVPGVFGSIIDYDYLEFRINQEIPLGLMGRSEIRANSGSFLRHKTLSLIDYRYQRRSDIFFFTPPMFAFQTLDSTFNTTKRFYEVHYRHHFNGALINKIPGFKYLGLRESAGGNMLYAPERRNMFFYEFYAGFDKLIRIWRDRFKLGIYYCVGYSNIFEKPRYGIKVNFEYFDRRNNSW